MKEREFITIARTTSMEQAYIVQSMLSSMGVESQVVNDIAADILPMLERDVRIIINAADYDKAKKIMAAKFDKDSYKTEWKEK